MTLTIAPPIVNGLLFGLTMSNGTDATNDIDFAAGVCIDSTNIIRMTATAIAGKQLDAAWAAGANAGGRMSAAAITNTTYHCFAIRKDSDGSIDFGFDTSPTAPTMPSGYTYFRRIGSIIRAGGTIRAFKQVGDYFGLDIPIGAGTANPGTSAVSVTLETPLGIVTQADITFGIYDVTPTVGTYCYVSPLDKTDGAPSSSNETLLITGSAGKAALIDQVTDRFNIKTDTSTAIRYRLDNSNADVVANWVTHGWTDTRGRLA